MEDLLAVSGDFGGPRWFGSDLDFPQRIFWGLMVVALGGLTTNVMAIWMK